MAEDPEKRPVYVSITGLVLNKPWHVIKFYGLATKAFKQAEEAEGNIEARVTTRGKVHHTLTVWESREDMLAYMTSGAHKDAMPAFHKIATGKTLGFETTLDQVPGWDDAAALWEEKAEAV